MQVTFLEAADHTPLTKTLSLVNGRLQKSAYPRVRDFNTHHCAVQTVREFFEQLKLHASLGHCALKGTCQKDLLAESRAGSTNALDTTEWVLLDVDGVPGVMTHEQFISQCLPDYLQSVSYVFQHSSSAIVDAVKGFSGHFFFLLSELVMATVLKDWLKELNLNSGVLAGMLTLTANQVTLRWPLDVTTCQNDKLIYIAPPVLTNIDDPIAERFVLVTKSHERIDAKRIRPQPALIDTNAKAKIKELRKALGLKAKEPVIREHQNGVNYIANPERAQLRGVPFEERGFVYVPLGSNPYTYYYPKEDPTFLYNFRGDPPVLLAELLPDYWDAIKDQYKSKATDTRLLVFRDIRTDLYYNGFYFPETDEVEVHPCNAKGKLKDFCAQYGRPLPDPVPDWRMDFDPQDPRTVDFDERFINLFQPSPIIKQALALGPAPMPENIERVIRHALGYDEECYHHFLNWLAFIIQKRKKTMTAWVLHGVEGTGKGVLFHKVLTPILTDKYAAYKLLPAFEDQYNGWARQALLVLVDEIKISESKSVDRTLDIIKSMVTDPTCPIRLMRVDPFQAKSYLNFLFYSNHLEAMKISPSDRRFNVAPRQEEKLPMTDAQIARISAEVPQFAQFLMHFEVDEDRAHTPLWNAAKAEMQENSATTIDLFFRALKQGDATYFLEYYQERPTTAASVLAHENFRAVMRKNFLHPEYTPGTPWRMARDDLMAMYAYIQGDDRISPAKFSRIARFHGSVNDSLNPSAEPDRKVRGYHITWQTSKESLEAYLSTKVTSLVPKLEERRRQRQGSTSHCKQSCNDKPGQPQSPV